MDLDTYENITGTSVSSAKAISITAVIAKVKSILENMLGFTLDPDLIATNQYEEIGKTPTECPCPEINPDTLLEPDSVEFAYRLYSYHKMDMYLMIDPATAVHKVKLVKDGVTFKTLEEEDYRLHFQNGLVKYIEVCDKWCTCTNLCYCLQLAVDADWLWETLPDDLLQIWAESVTFYSDIKKDIRSQVLGSHSYTKFDNTPPEQKDYNLVVLNKYKGPNGSLSRIPTA